MNPGRYHNVIAGWPVASPATFESPSSSRHSDSAAIIPAATLDQIRLAGDAARRAFATWRATPAPVRGQIMGQIGRAIGRAIEHEKDPR